MRRQMFLVSAKVRVWQSWRLALHASTVGIEVRVLRAGDLPAVLGTCSRQVSVVASWAAWGSSAVTFDNIFGFVCGILRKMLLKDIHIKSLQYWITVRNLCL